MSEEELEGVLAKLDHQKHCFHKTLTSDDSDGAKRFEYVIKDLKSIDFKLQYFIRSIYPNVQKYTSSRRGISNYIITKLWYFMKTNHNKEWSAIKDKYSFILEAKKQKKILFDSQYKNISGYNVVSFRKNKSHYHIYIREDIFKTNNIRVRKRSKSLP